MQEVQTEQMRKGKLFAEAKKRFRYMPQDDCKKYIARIAPSHLNQECSTVHPSHTNDANESSWLAKLVNGIEEQYEEEKACSNKKLVSQSLAKNKTNHVKINQDLTKDNSTKVENQLNNTPFTLLSTAFSTKRNSLYSIPVKKDQIKKTNCTGKNEGKKSPLKKNKFQAGKKKTSSYLKSQDSSRNKFTIEKIKRQHSQCFYKKNKFINKNEEKIKQPIKKKQNKIQIEEKVKKNQNSVKDLSQIVCFSETKKQNKNDIGPFSTITQTCCNATGSIKKNKFNKQKKSEEKKNIAKNQQILQSQIKQLKRNYGLQYKKQPLLNYQQLQLKKIIDNNQKDKHIFKLVTSNHISQKQIYTPRQMQNIYSNNSFSNKKRYLNNPNQIQAQQIVDALKYKYNNNRKFRYMSAQPINLNYISNQFQSKQKLDTKLILENKFLQQKKQKNSIKKLLSFETLNELQCLFYKLSQGQNILNKYNLSLTKISNEERFIVGNLINKIKFCAQSYSLEAFRNQTIQFHRQNFQQILTSTTFNKQMATFPLYQHIKKQKQQLQFKKNILCSKELQNNYCQNNQYNISFQSNIKQNKKIINQRHFQQPVQQIWLRNKKENINFLTKKVYLEESQKKQEQQSLMNKVSVSNNVKQYINEQKQVDGLIDKLNYKLQSYIQCHQLTKNSLSPRDQTFFLRFDQLRKHIKLR